MSRYLITNGDKYYTSSQTSGPMIGAPASQAKRCKKDNAENILSLITISTGDPLWCVQKYFSSSTHKNYVITNASKFVGDNDLVVSKVEKARSFKTAADAFGYIEAHAKLLPLLGAEPIVVNDQYESVDTFGKKIINKTNLKQISVNRANNINKVKRTSLSKDMRLAVYKRDNGICQICGKPLTLDNFTIDHIVPLNRGGINDIDNYRCTCRRCNQFKSDSLDEEMVTMLKDVGSQYLLKHPNSDMMKKFVRSWVRGVISGNYETNI